MPKYSRSNWGVFSLTSVLFIGVQKPLDKEKTKYDIIRMDVLLMLKDPWGNEAIDFGSKGDMLRKYSNRVVVTVTDKPFGDVYVLFICSEQEGKSAYAYLDSYHKTMESKGIRAYGTGVNLGEELEAKRTIGFMGGAGYV